MDIDRLREFLYFARKLNITRVARDLNLAPSALSRHLSALETEVGTPLLTHGNPMRLTAAGSLMIEEASRVIEVYDAMISRVSGLTSSTRSIKVAYLFEDRAVTDAVSIARSRLMQQNEYVLITSLRPRESSIVEAVQKGEADVGITYRPDDLDQTLYEAVPVLREPLVAATRKDNVISTEPSIEASQLAGLTLPYPTTKTFDDYYKHIVELFRRHGIPINIKYVAAETAEEFYAHDEKLRLWCFTKSSFSAAGRILPYSAFNNSNFYEVRTEGFDADRYAIYRKDSVSEDVLTFVGILADLEEDLLG